MGLIRTPGIEPVTYLFTDTKRYQNCNIIWDDGVRDSMLHLDEYFLGSIGEDGKAGAWVYMQKKFRSPGSIAP